MNMARITNNDRYFAIMRKSGGRCWYCGVNIHPAKPGRPRASVDHLLSVRDGGADDDDNLVPACVPCNSSKCARGLDELRHNAAQRALSMPGFSREQIGYLRRKGFDLSAYDGFKFWFESYKSRHTGQRTDSENIDKTAA